MDHTQTQVAVDKAEVVNETYVMYTILIKILRRGEMIYETRIQKRFSDFVNLKSELQNEFQSNDFPYELPSRQYGIWSKQASLNQGIIEERKVKLAKFLYDLLNDSFDSKWRNSEAIKTFLKLPTEWNTLVSHKYGLNNVNIKPDSKPSGENNRITWLSLFRDCKGELEDCKRMVATDRTKILIQLRLKVNSLEKALARNDQEDIDTIELERRRNLLSTLKHDINELSLQPTSNNVPGSFHGTNRIVSDGSATNFFSTSSNETNLGLSKPPVGRRRFGETDQTALFDNQQLLTFHKTQMRSQDEELLELHKIIQKQKNVSIQMNQELSQQNELLDSFDQDIDQTASKLRQATRKAKQFNDSS